jgi:hypothetical protein
VGVGIESIHNTCPIRKPAAAAAAAAATAATAAAAATIIKNAPVRVILLLQLIRKTNAMNITNSYHIALQGMDMGHKLIATS